MPEVSSLYQLTEIVIEWMENNHLPLPNPPKIVPTLMEEKARRDAQQQEVSTYFSSQSYVCFSSQLVIATRTSGTPRAGSPGQDR
jgi:hypothetical protein